MAWKIYKKPMKKSFLIPQIAVVNAHSSDAISVLTKVLFISSTFVEQVTSSNVCPSVWVDVHKSLKCDP
jgi:hypothetical protein